MICDITEKYMMKIPKVVFERYRNEIRYGNNEWKWLNKQNDTKKETMKNESRNATMKKRSCLRKSKKWDRNRIRDVNKNQIIGGNLG